jgi:putative transposase
MKTATTKSGSRSKVKKKIKDAAVYVPQLLNLKEASSQLKLDIDSARMKKILEKEPINRDERGFWNDNSHLISANLWMPTKTELEKLNKRVINGANGDKTHRSYKYDPPVTQQRDWTVSAADASTDKLYAVKKLRFYPNSEQKVYFEKCFGAHRDVFNGSLWLDNFVGFGESLSEYTIRNAVVPNIDMLEPSHEDYWLKEIPCGTLQAAVNEYVTARQSCKTRKAKGQIANYEIKYQTKKEVQHFRLPGDQLKLEIDFVEGGYNRIIKSARLSVTRLGDSSDVQFAHKAKKWADKHLEIARTEITIIKDSSKQYYLCVPFIKKVKALPHKNKIVALDPGIRTFQTFYASDKTSGKLGEEARRKITKINMKIDKLNGLICTAKSKTKYNMKRRCSLLRTKAKNIVRDLHMKSASFLIKNYDCILLPELKTQQLVRTENRVIGKEAARSLLNFSHYKFRERISHLAKAHGKTVIICKENHTSMTCGNCSKQNQALGGDEEFVCDCGIVIDRDLNGARNILIRSLTKYLG